MTFGAKHAVVLEILLAYTFNSDNVYIYIYLNKNAKIKNLIKKGSWDQFHIAIVLRKEARNTRVAWHERFKSYLYFWLYSLASCKFAKKQG